MVISYAIKAKPVCRDQVIKKSAGPEKIDLTEDLVRLSGALFRSELQCNRVRIVILKYELSGKEFADKLFSTRHDNVRLDIAK